MDALPAARFAPSRSGTTPLLAALVLTASFALFRRDLASEPLFVDEAAFLSQSYFWDLATTGRWDDARWLEYQAYDLPPLPKYLIGASLQARGLPRPDRSWALAWYGNTSEARFVTPANLYAARMPSVLLGAFGCVAIFALGTMAADRRVGVLAAILLAITPLYRLHARRAMADVPAEALILATQAAGLALWARHRIGRAGVMKGAAGGLLVGTLAGLAVLTKLNGFLGIMVVSCWTILGAGISLASFGKVARAGALGLAMALLAGVLVFSLLNPFVTARPSVMPGFPLLAPVPPRQTYLERLKAVIDHRVGVSRHAQDQFPRNALRSPAEKLSVLAVQGFGRFGPFGPLHSDSTKRYDWLQDRGAVVYLPGVLAGLGLAVARGRRQIRAGEPPAAWALVILFGVAVVTVGSFLPLAWDRYLLPIQAGSALLASFAAISAFDGVRRRMVPR